VQETPRVKGAVLEAPAVRENGAAGSALVQERIEGLTAHSLAEGLSRTETFDSSGPLEVTYSGDFINVRMVPSNRDRFVVLNERYDPNWRARAETGELVVLPTNAVMIGVKIPPHVDRVELRFEPFSSTRTGHLLTWLAVLMFMATTSALWIARFRAFAAPKSKFLSFCET
jgi:hypothetical protein